MWCLAQIACAEYFCDWYKGTFPWWVTHPSTGQVGPRSESYVPTSNIVCHWLEKNMQSELQHIHQSTVARPLNFFSSSEDHIGACNCYFHTTIQQTMGTLRAQAGFYEAQAGSLVGNDQGSNFQGGQEGFYTSGI